MMKTLTSRDVMKFWMPLAGTWLMMSLEGPFIAAVIARLVDPKFNLAAYGVAFSFALIIEAPVIMMMTASTSLVKDYTTLKKLRQFTWILNAVITVLMLVLVIPRLFFFLTIDLIGLPEYIAHLTHGATLILLPWPAAIGFRRFYQGVLIRKRATRRVAFGTLIRLFSMGSTALLLYYYTQLPGVYIGTAALSAGVTMEAISTRIMVHSILRSMRLAHSQDEGPGLSFKGISRFYYPLALTSMLTLGVHPLITFFIGKSNMAIESLAVLPVVHSFVFLFRGVGLSFQEVAITLLGENEQQDRVIYRFATMLGLLLSGGLIFAAVTPISGIWFSQVAALSPQLASLTIIPLFVMGVFPATTVLISMQRAALVKAGNTQPITMATVIEVLVIIVALYINIIHLNAIGVNAAVTAYVAGRLAANSYLFFKTRTA